MKFKNIAEFLAYIIENKEPANLKDWVKVFNDMSVHTRERVPTELLLSRRPNEEKNIFEYRVANYEAITYGSMGRAINNLYRFLSGLSYTIQAIETLLKYIEQPVFDTLKFKAYMEQIVLTRMIEDPNGLLLWIPSGKGLKEQNKQVLVSPILVYSSDIIYFDQNYCAIKSNETVTYYDEEQKEKTGEVILAFDKLNFYKFIPIEEKGNEITYNIKLIYNHNLNDIPATILGGNMCSEGYYKSFFAAYNAFGNEAIRQFSDWQAIMVTSAFPYREELATTCDNEGCIHGYIKDTVTFKDVLCPRCHGIGKVINKSPYGVYVRQLPDKLNESTDDFSVPSLRFISPDVGIIEYSGKSWEMLIEKAEKTLALNYINEAQSGVAKDIDREELYALLNKIGNNFFDNLMLHSLQYINGYIDINNKETVSILKPFDFKIKSENDIITEISNLITNKAPYIFVAMSVNQLAKRKFDGNPLNMKIFEVVSLWDKLSIYNNEDKISMVSSGSVSDNDYIKSIYSYQLTMQLISEITQDSFMKMSFNEIYKRLDEMIKPYFMPEKTPIIETGNIE